MKFVTALLALLLIAAAPAPPRVEPIQKLVRGERGLCTTWNVAPNRWVTDDHCVKEGGGMFDEEDEHYVYDFTIAGKPAKLVKAEPAYDLALLVSQDLVSVPLKVAKDKPDIGDPVTIVGFPRMWELNERHDPITLKAEIRALSVKSECSAAFQIIMQGPIAGGNSGSPIFRGSKVVSVGQCYFSSGLVGGARWEDLVDFLK